MILSDAEYKTAVSRARAAKKQLAAEKAKLEREGLPRAEIKRLLDPVRSFYLQFAEEAESYKRLKRGEFDELVNFQGLGLALIAVRIYMGMTQRELAEKLGVHESQVSRDERNEYDGLTVGRAERIMEALGMTLQTTVLTKKPHAA